MHFGQGRDLHGHQVTELLFRAPQFWSLQSFFLRLIRGVQVLGLVARPTPEKRSPTNVSSASKPFLQTIRYLTPSLLGITRQVLTT